MVRRWSHALMVAVLLHGFIGCAQVTSGWQRDAEVEPLERTASHDVALDSPRQPLTAATGPLPPPAEPDGPQSVEVYVRRALVENRTVQAAYHNVRSLRYRIPQVTALDDPTLSNTIFPIPSVAPQYSLMGYNPYNATLAQQFPWAGTLRLRGEVADRDVQVALAELAAAQLDAIAAVKRAYADLYVGQKTGEILAENRKVLEDFRAVAKSRIATGGTQQDVIRSEILLSELDRGLLNNEQGIAGARAALARQVHASPEADLRAMSELPVGSVPAEIETLYQLAAAARPELKGRLAAIARDEKAVELARKRFYPNVTLGLTYMDMEKTNATTPRTASGSPNVGLFVGFNLPVYRNKYRAGVCEAEERTLADAKLFEAQRDETFGEIKDVATQVRVQQNVLALLRESILPRTRETMDLSRSDYAKGNVDYATILSALREVLQVQLQVVQIEGELSKALASLERAVGCQWKDAPSAVADPEPSTPITQPPPMGESPFRSRDSSNDTPRSNPDAPGFR